MNYTICVATTTILYVMAALSLLGSPSLAGVQTAGLEPLQSRRARSRMDGIRWRAATTLASHQFLGHADRTSKN